MWLVHTNVELKFFECCLFEFTVVDECYWCTMREHLTVYYGCDFGTYSKDIFFRFFFSNFPALTIEKFVYFENIVLFWFIDTKFL